MSDRGVSTSRTTSFATDSTATDSTATDLTASAADQNHSSNLRRRRPRQQCQNGEDIDDDDDDCPITKGAYAFLTTHAPSPIQLQAKQQEEETENENNCHDDFKLTPAAKFYNNHRVSLAVVFCSIIVYLLLVLLYKPHPSSSSSSSSSCCPLVDSTSPLSLPNEQEDHLVASTTSATAAQVAVYNNNKQLHLFQPLHRLLLPPPPLQRFFSRLGQLWVRLIRNKKQTQKDKGNKQQTHNQHHHHQQQLQHFPTAFTIPPPVVLLDGSSSSTTTPQQQQQQQHLQELQQVEEEQQVLQDFSRHVKHYLGREKNMLDWRARMAQVPWGGGGEELLLLLENDDDDEPEDTTTTTSSKSKNHKKKRKNNKYKKKDFLAWWDASEPDGDFLDQLDGGHLLYSYYRIMKLATTKAFLASHSNDDTNNNHNNNNKNKMFPRVNFPFRKCGGDSNKNHGQGRGCVPAVAIEHTLQWRQVYQPWKVDPSVLRENANGWVYTRGFTKGIPFPSSQHHQHHHHHHPLVYGRHAILWARPGVIGKSQDGLAYIRSVLHSADLAVAKSLQASQGRVGKFNAIIDLQGYEWGRGQLPALSVLKQVVTMLQDHFPDRLGVIVLINLSRTAELVINLIKPWLTKEVREKIHTISHDHHQYEKLQYLIEPEYIPYWLGGPDDYQFDVQTYYSPHMYRDFTEQDAREFVTLMPYHAY